MSGGEPEGFLPNPGQKFEVIPPDFAAGFAVLASLVSEARAYLKSDDFVEAGRTLDRAYGEVMKVTKPVILMDDSKVDDFGLR